MTFIHELIAGPWGSFIAILAMAIATFLCRISGAVLMTHVDMSPRVERGFRALPGSIVVATILPAVIDNGIPAIIALSMTIVAMALTRKELIALVAGLGSLSLIRALGF